MAEESDSKNFGERAALDVISGFAALALRVYITRQTSLPVPTRP